MTQYYAKKLSGDRLKRCYACASPRVAQYLEAEILFVLRHLRSTHTVLELGCGYGRVALRMAEVASRVVGVDTAEDSQRLARQIAGEKSNCSFLNMNAIDLQFEDNTFDRVICIQNGICAFRVDQEILLREALRVLQPGGVLLLSTYADRFWPHRLKWFRIQAELGLVGQIDEAASGNGVIVCKDGFKSSRLLPSDFKTLAAKLGCLPKITEVDKSSLFCEFNKS